MFSRIAKPTVAWILASAAAIAQQPPLSRPPVNAQPASANRQFQQPAQPQAQAGQAQAQLGKAGQAQLGQAGQAQAQPGQRVAGQPGAPANTFPQLTAAQQAQVAAAQQAALQEAAMRQQQALEQQLAVMPFDPLNEAQQKYLDQVLNVWEQRTATIKRYQCDFTRWVFDPSQNSNPDAASKAQGLLKFMDPDKGLFRIDKLEFFAGRDPKTNGPMYQENQRQKYGEYWICDGDYVHILDRNEKKCTKYQLPPQNRGKDIYRSPLPFLFGVKASEIYARYWVRPIAPPANSKDVYLETYPKRADDAGNYSRVQIVLDAQEVLPKALVVFLPNYRPDQPHREIYEFTNRSDQTGNAIAKLQEAINWKEDFIPTTLTKEWTIIVEPYEVAEPAGQAQAAGAVPNPGQTQVSGQFQNPAAVPAGQPRTATQPQATGVRPQTFR